MNKKYFDELKHLTDLSLVAIEELDNTIKNITEGDFGRNMTLAWHHIDGILIYTARISRVLWGDEKEETQKRGEKIREILDISDNSIFHYKNRDVRNDFDHIDERIDDVEKGLFNINLSVDLNIADPDTMIGNMNAGDYARHYDPRLKIIYFGRNNLPILPLMTELKEVENKINNYKKRV